METVLQLLDLNVFLEQTAGEFGDRLENAGITLIMNLNKGSTQRWDGSVVAFC